MRSISTLFPLFNQVSNRGEHPIPKNCPPARSEIRPFDRRRPGRFRNNPCHNAVALAQFNHLTGFKPGKQLAGVAELAKIHAWHAINVAQNVSQCQSCPKFALTHTAAPPPALPEPLMTKDTA